MPQWNDDRNLMFGVAAWRAELLSRDALVDALDQWSARPGNSLGEWLVERGLMTEGQRHSIDQEVDERLAQNAAKTTQTWLGLAAAGGSLGEAATSRIAELMQESGAHQPPAHAGSAQVKPGHVLAGEERYRLVRPHASGGLGMIWMAHDHELDRTVALKEMKGKTADDGHSRARFVREAEITGKLEHPGIVPIYSLGRHADGRPYYAMQFIQGQSLKEAIGRYHEGRDNAKPAARALHLRELLSRFVDVCNAVAYAHNRGIVHRDLKPGNVMLGAFGETLVVDWGLAKSFSRRHAGPSNLPKAPDADAPPPLISMATTAILPGDQTAADSAVTQPGPVRLVLTATEDDATEAGAVLGTPFYMSPEQARGDQDAQGPASDVYGLGAILYSILTGKIPGSPSSAGITVDALGVVAPRRLDPSIPRALEAICQKAMAALPAARYDSATALADDVKRWMADEAVKVCQEPLLQRIGRLARRHRTIVTALAAAGVVGLCTLAWAYSREAASAATLANLNRKLAAEQKQTLEAKSIADAHLDHAVTSFGALLADAGAAAFAEPGHGPRARLLAAPRRFFERLVDDFDEAKGDRPREQALLTEGRLGLGRIAELTGSLQDARKEYETALVTLSQIESGNRESRFDAARQAELHARLGNVLEALGEPTRAAESFRGAIAHERSTDASHDQRRARLDDHHGRLGLALRNAGQASAAAKTARDRLALWPPNDADALLRAAIELAACVALLDPQKSDERHLARDYKLEAVDLLERAWQARPESLIGLRSRLESVATVGRPVRAGLIAAYLDRLWPAQPFADN